MMFSLLEDESHATRRYTLKQKGLKRIHSTEFWLEDEHINQAMSLLHRTYQNIDGFQDVCVIETGMAKKMNDPWIQVFNKDGNHWITATTVGCDMGVVRIYDSLYRHIPKLLLKLIIKLTGWAGDLPLIIEMPQFQKQRTRHDCGLFAIAAMVDLCKGRNPTKSKYDLNYMRAHLVSCLKNGYLDEFPEYSGNITSLKPAKFTYFICRVCALITESDSKPVTCNGCQNQL